MPADPSNILMPDTAPQPAGNDSSPFYKSFVAAAGFDPDAEAKARAAARMLPAPVTATRAQPQLAQQQVDIQQQQANAQHIAQSSPQTQTWYSKLTNAIVGKDDTGVLGALGSILGLGPAAMALRPAVSAGAQAGTDLATNPKGTLHDIRPINLGKSIAAGVIGPIVGTYTGAESFLGDTAPALLGGLAQKAQQQRQAWTQFRNTNLNPDAQTFTGKAINQGVEGLPLVATAILAPEAAPAIFGGTAGLTGYGEARDQGAGPNRALLYGGINAGINFGLGKFLGGQAETAAAAATDASTGNNVGQFFKNLVTSKFVAQDLGLNALAGEAQNFNQWATLDENKGKTFSDWLAEQPAEVGQNIIGTLTMLGAMHGTGVAARMFDRLSGRSMDRDQQMQQAEQTHGMLQEMSTLSTASKLRERDPEGFHDFVSQASQDGPVDNVYVDPQRFADALHQSDLEPQAAAAVQKGLAQNYADAVTNGTDMRIPIADYETNLAGTSIDKALLEHLKVDPDGMTRAEAGDWLHQNGERVAQEMSDALSSVKQGNDWNQSTQNVHDAIKAQLDKANPAGRSTNKNESDAAMMSNAFATMADRLKNAGGKFADITPEDLYRQFGPKIVGEANGATTTTPDGRLDQVSAGGRGARRAGDAGEPQEPRPAPLPGSTKAGGEQFGPIADVVRAARTYAAKQGINLRRQSEWTRVNPDLAKRIAGAYEAMQHAPNDPKVKAAYEDLKSQTLAQYEALHDHGFRFRLHDQTNDPYLKLNAQGEPFSNPWAALRDLRDNKRMSVLATEAAFGSDFTAKTDDNPLLEKTGIQWPYGPENGPLKDVTYNDLFRAVHDAFGHGMEGAGFRAEGEENAWQAHERLFTGAARGALTSETRGQNSWLNFGRYAEHNRAAGVHDTIYADQKTGLLPEWAWNEGRLGDQDFEHALAQENHGAFDPAQNVIALFKTANLSTFQHESAHFYLEFLNKLTKDPEAPQQIRDDLGQIMDWFGIKGGPAEWNQMSLEQQRPYHEQFARGFEAYLFSGKAPNLKLQPLFQRFRQFMLSVYQKISALGVRVSPEIRGVYDRMLATDNEIAEAEHARSMLPLGKEHFDENSWREYQQQLDDAHQGSVSELEARSLRDMQWLTNARGREVSRLQKQVEGLRASTRQQVETEVKAEPVYQAIDYLKNGRFEGEKSEGAGKLSIDAVKKIYPNPEDYARVADALGTGRHGMLGRENAIDPKQAADLFGFSSGEHLIKAITETQPLEDRVNGITEQRLLEDHGELTTEQGIKEAADRAIFSDLRARVMATELNALNKKAGRPAILAQAARAYAETQIARTRVRDLKPALFEAAAARSGRAVMEQLAKGKTTEAAAEKRNQLINTYMAKEAIRAKDEIGKALAYFDRMNRATGKQVDRSYLSQIHALLDRVDLKQNRTLKDIDSTTSLADWIKSQQADGFDPIVTEDMAARLSQAGSYKNMSIEDIRGLRDSIKNIEALGRLKNKLLTAQSDRTFAEFRDTLAGSIESNSYKDRTPPLETHGAGYGVKKTLRSAITSLRRFGSLAYEMDGFKVGGPAWELLKRPLDRAADRETELLTQSGEALKPLFEKLGKFKGPFGVLTDEKYIPEIGQSISLEGRLAIALNMGNEINRERVMRGYNWSPAQVDAILRSLTAEHWQAVQGIWDHIGSYWPQIEAKQERVTGVKPERVEPTPIRVHTADGQDLELDGGYYPIKYDGEKSDRAAGHDAAQVATDMLRGAYTASTTRRGHTQARVESTGMPLDLKLSVLSRHLQEVIHDLTHHEALIDVTRLLRDQRVSQAIRNNYGPEVRDYVSQVYKDVAAGNVPVVKGWAKMVDWLRTGLISSQLGFNLFVPTLHVTNLHKATQAIGAEYMAKATAKFVADAASMKSTVDWVAGQSPFMKQRAVKGMAELAGIHDNIAGKTKVQQFAEHYGFYLIEKGQLMADIPTWLAQYMKSTDAGEAHERAVELADEVVRRVQGGGRKIDTAAILRSDQNLMKLFTAYYGFTNSNFNLQAEAINRARAATGSGGLVAAAKVSPMLLSATVAYTFAPALYHLAIHSLLQGQGPDKNKLKALPLTAVMQLFPFARDFVPLVQDLASGGKARGVAPAGLPYDPFVRMANDLHHGNWDWHTTTDAATLAGMFSHLPLGQVVRTAHGIQAVAEGKTKNPGALIVGPSPAGR